jgi:hypothetical protein
MNEEQEITKVYKRAEILKTCREKIAELEEKCETTSEEISTSLRNRHTRFRNKFPRWIRWIIPKELSYDKIHFEKPINAAKMTQQTYLECFYRDPIEGLEKIQILCERNDGEHVRLTDEEFDLLTYEP